jgi:hypothetical protein
MCEDGTRLIAMPRSGEEEGEGKPIVAKLAAHYMPFCRGSEIIFP